jgi:hypothetical protein
MNNLLLFFYYVMLTLDENIKYLYMEIITVYVILIQTCNGSIVRIEYCSMQEYYAKRAELIEQ